MVPYVVAELIAYLLVQVEREVLVVFKSYNSLLSMRMLLKE
jgi:hypothetical protein